MLTKAGTLIPLASVNRLTVAGGLGWPPRLRITYIYPILSPNLSKVPRWQILTPKGCQNLDSRRCHHRCPLSHPRLWQNLLNNMAHMHLSLPQRLWRLCMCTTELKKSVGCPWETWIIHDLPNRITLQRHCSITTVYITNYIRVKVRKSYIT
jgi:hypothetical protein